MTALNTDQLKAWQQHVMNTAKAILQSEGHLSPMLFVRALKKNVPEHFLAQIPPEAQPDDDVTVMMPLNLRRRDLLNIAMSMNDKVRETVEMLVSVKPDNFDDERLEKLLLGGIMTALNIEEKDLVAKGIIDILREFKAYAFIKVDETWRLMAKAMEGKKRTDYPKSLENEEAAGEAISVWMECDEFIRGLSVPFTRTVRNTGRVTGFGEQEEMLQIKKGTDEEKAKGIRLAGRFVGMLEQSRKTPEHLN